VREISRHRLNLRRPRLTALTRSAPEQAQRAQVQLEIFLSWGFCQLKLRWCAILANGKRKPEPFRSWQDLSIRRLLRPYHRSRPVRFFALMPIVDLALRLQRMGWMIASESVDSLRMVGYLARLSLALQHRWLFFQVRVRLLPAAAELASSLPPDY